MEQLDISKTIKLLEKSKLNFVKSKIVKTPEDAVKAAKELKFPIALKLISKDILHKSDEGFVEISLQNENEVLNVCNKMIKRYKKRNYQFLIQRMASGFEVIVGMKKDSQFGNVIIFGLGGIFTEILKDTSLRIAPVDKKEAIEMIKEIKSFQILNGARGKKPINLSLLADIISRTSNLKNIEELDFNPIIVNENSAVIVDARIMI